MRMIKKVADIFQQKFSSSPLIVRSPGRVNIIGEHTDYNDGFILPAAINKAVYVAISKRNDNGFTCTQLTSGKRLQFLDEIHYKDKQKIISN